MSGEPKRIEAGRVRGAIRAPASKSLTNRALVLAAQAEGESILRNASDSEDTARLRGALALLGISTAEPERGTIVVAPGPPIPQNEPVRIDVGNAGTTLRFLLPLLALRPGVFDVDGSPRMRERPIAPLLESLGALGARIRPLDRPGRLPIRIEGGALRGGRVRLDASESSQFLSGLLLVSPSLPEPLEVELAGPLASPSYVALTEKALAEFGVGLERRASNFRIRNGRMTGRPVELESDWSGATYLLAAAVLAGGPLEISGLHPGSPQGDAAFLDWMLRMGGAAEWRDGGLVASTGSSLRGIEVSAGDSPDAVPTLAAVATFATGETVVSGARHLRAKESDRIATVALAVRTIGGFAEEREDGLRIVGRPELRSVAEPVLVRTFDDHRLAMSFAVSGLARPGISIEDPACVAKSWPRFWDALDSIRAS